MPNELHLDWLCTIASIPCVTKWHWTVISFSYILKGRSFKVQNRFYVENAYTATHIMTLWKKILICLQDLYTLDASLFSHRTTLCNTDVAVGVTNQTKQQIKHQIPLATGVSLILCFQMFKLSSKLFFSINYILLNNHYVFLNPYYHYLFYKSRTNLASKTQLHLVGIFW